MKEPEECPECKGEIYIVYSYTMGKQLCKTCRGSGTTDVKYYIQ